MTDPTTNQHAHAGRTRWQQVGPWLIGAVAVAALLIGLQFVPAEAGPTDAHQPAGQSGDAP